MAMDTVITTERPDVVVPNPVDDASVHIFNPLLPNGTICSRNGKIRFLNKKRSLKKFPMSVAPMSR